MTTEPPTEQPRVEIVKLVIQCENILCAAWMVMTTDGPTVVCMVPSDAPCGSKLIGAAAAGGTS